MIAVLSKPGVGLWKTRDRQDYTCLYLYGLLCNKALAEQHAYEYAKFENPVIRDLGTAKP